jgi:hypothetical protein
VKRRIAIETSEADDIRRRDKECDKLDVMYFFCPLQTFRPQVVRRPAWWWALVSKQKAVTAKIYDEVSFTAPIHGVSRCDTCRYSRCDKAV